MHPHQLVKIAILLLPASLLNAAEPPPELPETAERPAVVAIIDQFHSVEKVERQRQSGALVIHLRGRGDKDKASTRLTFDPETGNVVAINGNAAGFTNEDFKLFAPLKELRLFNEHHNFPVRPGDVCDGAGIIHLQNNPKLEEITLPGSGFSNDALAALAQLPQVKRLGIWHVNVDDAGFAHLRAHPGLEAVRIAPMWRPRITDKTIEHLSHCPNLKSISLNEGYVTWENGLRHLVKLKGTFEELNLEHSVVAPEDLQQLREAMPEVAVRHAGLPIVGAMIRDNFKGAARLLPQWVPQGLLDRYLAAAPAAETTNRYVDEPEKEAPLQRCTEGNGERGDEPVNLLETIPTGATPRPAERALVVDFADRVNHVEAVYDETGAVVHLEISNHAMWISRHGLGEGRPGLSDKEFHRIAELRSLDSLRILQQPLRDDAYAVLAHFPDLKAFRIEGHRTDEDAGRSHRFMRHINHCPNLEALELKHLFGLRGTSVDKLRPMPKLEYLELDNDSAGPEALVFLAGCPNLRDFELHRTSMDDQQLGSMVDLLPKLERFVIKPGGPRLTAASLRHLQRLPKLQVVGLHQWKRPGSLPWQDGLEHLTELRGLQTVEFPGSYVTADSDEVRRLRLALPDLEFKGLAR